MAGRYRPREPRALRALAQPPGRAERTARAVAAAYARPARGAGCRRARARAGHRGAAAPLSAEVRGPDGDRGADAPDRPRPAELRFVDAPCAACRPRSPPARGASCASCPEIMALRSTPMPSISPLHYVAGFWPVLTRRPRVQRLRRQSDKERSIGMPSSFETTLELAGPLRRSRIG